MESLTKLGLLNVVADNQCAFGDLELVGVDGVSYRQSYSHRGTVTVSDEPTYLFWTVSFSPADEQGKVAPVTIEASYQFFKISGLVTVRYHVVKGSAQVTKLLISQFTRGPSRQSLDCSQRVFLGQRGEIQRHTYGPIR